MKTILSVIKNYMEKSKRDDYTFDEIFEQVEKELSPEWAKNTSYDFDDIVNNKKGETYKLLTVDGDFIRNEDGTFKLKHL
ncbi:hypothetical protein ACJA28_03085 [Mesomycoplasma moatsii]|uniref:hypothetical protein n=1 Tax=Mesomycoplasma moatsii TaxID=171287 RepID=UPI0003B3C156